MAKRHMKTLTVPTTWPVKRKTTKFTIRPNPGKSFELSMPIAIAFKNILKYAKTTKEVKTILMDKEILVDGKKIKDPKSLIGFMDTLSIPVSKEYYRILIKKSKRLYLQEITEKEAGLKICKIIGKTMLKKGRLQLNLFDSRNIIVKKDEYKVGDSILLSVPKQNVEKVLKLEKGAYAYMVSGKHIGEHGVIEEINKDIVKIKADKDSFETTKESLFIIGKTKPEIKID